MQIMKLRCLILTAQDYEEELVVEGGVTAADAEAESESETAAADETEAESETAAETETESETAA